MDRSIQARIETVDAPASEVAATNGLPQPGVAAMRLVIGRREWLALPDLGVYPLHAKTDSGARSSCLHAEQIELSPDQTRVSFITTNHHGQTIACEAPVARFGRVRSSSGAAAKRVFIQTTALLGGGLRWPILLSLANRADMRCPLLLGRRALAGYFVIEPAASHLLGSRSRLERELRNP